MKRLNPFILAASIIFVLSSVLLTSCSKEDPEPEPLPDLAFIGDETCKTCHDANYTDYMKSGHPYKINKVTNNQSPIFPYAPTTVPLPEGTSAWNQISYVIGGYGWKARYIGLDGNVITGPNTQFNVMTGSMSNYSQSNPSYNCGQCHNTGWVTFADGGKRQDNMPGMDGAWFQPGVRCEACHGMGNQHSISKEKQHITIDRTYDQCNVCHKRNKTDDKIITATSTSGTTFTMHRSTGDELKANGHKNLEKGCVTCHDPHIGVLHGNAAMGGIQKNCSACHTDPKLKDFTHYDAKCNDCHMPNILKNATNKNKYIADERSHLFKIQMDTTSSQYTADNKHSNGFITLAYSCYQCHKDVDGIGGDKSKKSLTALLNKAKTFHK